ncbi:hypothetical protein LUZ63_016573 [Rhynchospora breviuscula]|uniref:KANL3/Tex30 alpha/beta hydrolase-like domain-containing protein n=1 Tax=Rhynchospora breviuscula TaxID=2022672 RepID=A0A9P9ZAP9_9POAL|nr:hypothetical protein LUZ63_016573 [Rhynchospora breviuscula]
MASDPPPSKRRRSDGADAGTTSEGHYPPTKQRPVVVFSQGGGGDSDDCAASTTGSVTSLQMTHAAIQLQGLGSRPLEVRPLRELRGPAFLSSSWPVMQGWETEFKGASHSTKESPLVVFAHGGGAPSTSQWMIKWKELIGEALNAIEVVTFDYPYILAKRKAPPKAEKLVDHHLKIVKDALAKHPGHPLVLMGKSLGSRVSCMIAGADGLNVASIVCLGYPLKGMNGALRDSTLLELQAPTLFVQGSNDCQCPLDKLEFTRRQMSCKNEVYIIDGGDHSFQIGKKSQESSGMTQDQAERTAAHAIAQFVFRSIRGS